MRCQLIKKALPLTLFSLPYSNQANPRITDCSTGFEQSPQGATPPMLVSWQQKVYQQNKSLAVAEPHRILYVFMVLFHSILYYYYPGCLLEISTRKVQSGSNTSCRIPILKEFLTRKLCHCKRLCFFNTKHLF